MKIQKKEKQVSGPVSLRCFMCLLYLMLTKEDRLAVWAHTLTSGSSVLSLLFIIQSSGALGDYHMNFPLCFSHVHSGAV